jgi:hypothetical protein
MKKTILVTLAGLMLSASVAMAAAPAAPVYSMTVSKTKISEGSIGNPGGRSLFVDGTTVYAVTSSAYGDYGVAVNLTRSLDNGNTWEASEILVAGDTIGWHGMGIAVTADKVNTGKKIIHSLWAQSPEYGSAYSTFYRYYSTQSNAWSDPVTLNGSQVSVDSDGVQQLTVDGLGKVHAFFRSGNLYYYTSSSAPGAIFTEPVAISPDALSGSMAVDSSNNVLFAYTTADGAYFRKKLAAGSTWSTPVKMGTDAALNDNNQISIAALDANNMYVSHSASASLRVYKSINAGSAWTQKVVTAASGISYEGTSIAVNKSTKAVTIGITENNNTTSVQQRKIFRSADGVTWSAATILNANSSGGNQSIAIDSTGKTLILHNSAALEPSFGYADHAIYVSREK